MPGLDRSPRLARFNNFEFDLRAGELRQDSGATVRLGEQPFQILLALLEHPGEVLLREEVRKRLWPNDTIVEFEHSINAAMNRLRQALGDSAEKPRYIETLARRGYRWMIPVEWVEVGPKNSPAAPTPIEGTQRTRESLIGKKVSHYRILEVLGGGGMGVVYKAEDLKLGRCVALKFLGEELIGDRRSLERFEREARAISALDHANICTIHEVEEQEGQPFIVMQLLQGQTLRQRIESAGPAKSAFSAGELLDFAVQIASGLEAAHQKGIIHRDVKPANIFITNRGEIKLLDFGLAKLMDAGGVFSESVRQLPETGPQDSAIAGASRTSMTLTGAMMGTASYMSPEQVRKEPLDARSDLFSFGVVLYEMATGCQPFRGAGLESIHDAVLNHTPPSPRMLNPDLPIELESIIGRALEKDRGRRYQSASEIIADLQRLKLGESGAMLASGTEKSLPVERTVPFDLVARVFGTQLSRVKLSIVVIAVGLVLLAGGFLVVRGIRRSSNLPLQAFEITTLTDSGKADQVAISPDGRYVAYAQREAQGVGLWVRQIAAGGEVEILRAKADGFNGLTFSPDGSYIYFVPNVIADSGRHSLYAMPTLGGSQRLLVKDQIDSPVSFSPDGQRFVFTNGIGDRNVLELRIADIDGSNNRLLAAIPDGSDEFQPGPAWSPDGRTIAVPVMIRGGFVLDAVSVSDGSSPQVYSSAYGIGRPVWVSTDELIVPLQGRDGHGQLWTISYPRGQIDRLTNDLEDYRDFGIGFSREAKALTATISNHFSNVWIASAANPSGARQVTFGKMAMLGVSTTAQGRILIRSGDGHLWIMNDDGSQRSPFTDTTHALSLTSCNQFVLFESYASEKVDLTRVDADGNNAVKLVSGDIGPPVCSEDGHVFYVNLVKPHTMWRIGIQGGLPIEIAKSPGINIPSRMSVSPDSKLLAFIYDEATPRAGTKLAVIPATGGPILRTYEAPSDLAGLYWSPDGHQLQYLLTRDAVTNIWEQPLDGGPPRQVTMFSSGRIFDFNWSRDGKRLLLARGEVSSDVVLLSHLH